jgi:hypothetical protein
MTGPEHYSKAEELAAEAHKLLGQGDGQATAAVWAAVAQVHATLALAAATAAGTAGAGSQAPAESVLGPGHVIPVSSQVSGENRPHRKPRPPDARRIGQGPVAEQPPGRHPAP